MTATTADIHLYDEDPIEVRLAGSGRFVLRLGRPPWSTVYLPHGCDAPALLRHLADDAERQIKETP